MLRNQYTPLNTARGILILYSNSSLMLGDIIHYRGILFVKPLLR